VSPKTIYRDHEIVIKNLQICIAVFLKKARATGPIGGRRIVS
jgi:hypothetical protein